MPLRADAEGPDSPRSTIVERCLADHIERRGGGELLLLHPPFVVAFESVRKE